MYEDGLAATGAGALLIGGTAVGLPTIIAIAAAIIIAGIFLLRVTTRAQRRQD